jgi:hypothetical protein
MMKRLIAALRGNAVAWLALFVSLGGTSLAAKHYLLSSSKQISPKVLKALEARDATVFKRLAKSVPVNSAAHADTAGTATSASSATTATTATTAGSATTATNALNLDGTPASGITHSDCDSRTGQVKGFALIPASSKFPATFTSVTGAYNCSGQPVEVLRRETGEYRLKFLGNPESIAITTANTEDEGFPNLDVVAVESIVPGEWDVAIYNAQEAKSVDDPFEVLVP